MPEDSEATPLLRGRATVGDAHGAVASVPQREGQQEGARGRYAWRHQAALLSRARSRPLLVAVVAVGAAVLVIAVGLLSTSGQAGIPHDGGASLAAAAPRGSSRGSGQVAGGQGAEDVVRERAAERGRDGSEDKAKAQAGPGKRVSSSTVAGGGWRSQPERAAGSTAVVESGDEAAVGTSTVTANTNKPNVFFFLIDDMGFGDIGYQSTDLSELTPNLDKLAAGGVKLTNYYTMTLCTPARASIMTGRYPVRYGLQYAVIMPGSPWGLPLNEKILPQYMNEAGYESHMVGKWHLGSHKAAALPNNRGFKSYLGYLHGIETYYSHKNTEAILDDRYFFDFGYGNATGFHDVSDSGAPGATCPDGRGGPSWDDDSRDSLDPADVCYTGTYSTDAFLGRARQVVQSKTPFDEEPLFMYVAHQSVHAPTGPAPWDAFTAEEQEQLNAVREATGSDKRVRFAGVLKFLDKRIGNFVDMLEEEGWLENSVIVVASDNGACPSDGGTNYPLRGGKQSVFEGGSKVPAFVWSKSHLPSEAWGTSYDKIMHSTDWVPTLASMAGGKVGGSAGPLDGVDQWDSLKSTGLVKPAEEGSFNDLMGDTVNDPRTEMLYNWDSYLLSSTDGLQENRDLTQGAFRSGDWKLLVNVWCSGYYSHDAMVIQNDELLNPDVTCGGTGECEDCMDMCQSYPDTYGHSDKLYNLRNDPREEHDLYDKYPEIAKYLRKRAEEVAYAEWTGSRFLQVDTDSYLIWTKNNWWMLPWEEIKESLQQQQSRPKSNLNGIAARNTRGGGEGEASKSSATANTKPNVFFLLIDDMGYGDIGYQSTDLDEISPNLDKLAAGGVKLTNYYSMVLCSPARASIMTGRYPVRYGMQYTVVQAGAPWGLPLNEKILPQYMNGAGYESHMVGKWHLGGHKLAALPNQRGFKSYLGYLYGSDTYYTHKGASCSNELRGPSWDDDSHDSLDPPDVCYTGTYSTDIFVGRARQIVQSKTPFDEEPLFLYLAHQAVHSPLGPAPWDAFTPEEQHLLDAVRNKTGSAVRAKFAGVLMFLDKRIGAFVDMLEQEGWLENSVIVVASDNGGCPVDGGSNYPLRGTKQSVYEGGRKVPAFVWSKSHLPSEVWGTSYDKIMHSTDWVPTLASLTGAELSGGALSPPEADDGSNDPRKEVLHSWDYVQKQEGKNVTQGAYRLGNWKLLLDVWCTGYYSHDLDVIENDPLLDPEVACSRGRACDDCAGTCDLEPDMYTRSNKLFNIKDDPREEHDLYDQYPEIVEQIRQRAEEVVKSEWTPAGLVPVNHASYEVWAENGWWISPWEEILEGTG
eukprot:g13381.t1